MNLADQPTVPQSVIGTASTEVDIPFKKLHISRKNTRIKPHSMADIECRAASIMAYGLLNRLQVIPEQGSGTEFGVIAGAGRYLSIELLVQRGLVPEDFPVKCDLRSTDDAIAISLVENANRTAPHEADEFVAFEQLLGEFENLYLDTAMAIAGYFSRGPDLDLIRRNPTRILYGTDYPNLPYEWTRELDVIRGLKLPPEDEARVLGGNAARLFGITAG